MRIATGLIVFITAAVLSLGAAADEQIDPRKPAAIETQEVPVVPDELIKKLEQYQNTRGAGFSGWDPAGKGILIRTRFGNSVQLHRVYTPEGRREQITFYDEPVSGGFIPGDKQGGLLLSMSEGGDENNQIYYLDRENFETTLLTDGKSRNSIYAIQEDGGQMVVGSNQRNGRDTDLYLADPRKAVSLQMLMKVDKEFWYAADWSPDETTLLLNRYVSANESYPHLFTIKTKDKKEILRPAQNAASYGPMAFTADGQSILIASDALGEFKRLALLHLSGGVYEWLTTDIDWDVDELDVYVGQASNRSRPEKNGQVADPAYGRAAFTVNADGASRLFLLEPKGDGGFERRELALPLGIVASLEFSPDGKHLGFTLARPDAPADAYSLEISSGEITRWTVSEVGGLNPETFIKPQRIEFRSFDGRMIPAWYYKPTDGSPDKKVPVVINIHGGPEGQSQPYFSGTTQFYLNEMGIAVIYPNVRGSSGYGKTYLKLDNAEKREDSVKDIGALLDWIEQQPELDASRVAVSGGSYGGYMVLASLVHFGDRIKAGMDAVGIANFSTFLTNTSPYRQDLRRAEYGDERDPKMQAVFERISPANHADKIQASLLISHGKNDPRVPFSEAQQIAEKVRASGEKVWTVYAENEGHGFGKKENADYLRAVEALFLQKALLK